MRVWIKFNDYLINHCILIITMIKCIHPWVDLLLIMKIPWVDNAAWFQVLPPTILRHDPSLGLLITLKHKEYLMFLLGMVFVSQEFLWIKGHTFASSLDVYATLVGSSKFVLVIGCESCCCYVGIFENVVRLSLPKLSNRIIDHFVSDTENDHFVALGSGISHFTNEIALMFLAPLWVCFCLMWMLFVRLPPCNFLFFFDILY